MGRQQLGCGVNREDLIEAAARQIWDEDEAEYWGEDPSRRPFAPDFDDEDGEHAAEWLETVTRVADKLLPQITTAEQLEALPLGTWLLSEEGIAYRWYANSARDDLPLTVVWQPQDDKGDAA